MRRIGVLLGASADEDDADAQARVVAFQQAMQQLGWTDGRNMQIDIRRGGGDAERIRKYAVELAALAPEVIVTAGASTVTPLLHATRTVPIVFTTVVDPVGAQVSSIAWRDRAATPPASCSSSTA